MERPIVNNISVDRMSLLVAKLATKHFECRVNSVTCLGGGSFGTAFKVAIKDEPKLVVIKVCKIEKMNIKEAYDLKEIAKHSSVAIPEVYFTHNKTAEIPIDCLCMEYIMGKNVFSDYKLLFKSRKKKRVFAETIINSMLQMHEATNPKFGLIENPLFDNWLDYYKPYALDILTTVRSLRAKGEIDGYILDTMERAWLRFDDIFSQEVTTASLIHGDLNVMNIMAKDKFEVSAIIDPLKSMYADREFDLFQLNNLTGKRFGLYDMYKEKYAVSEKCDIKCAFYALWNELACGISSGKFYKSMMKAIVKNMNNMLKNYE